MHRLVLALVCSCLTFSASFAQFAIMPTTDSLTDCSAPALAADQEGMVSLAFLLADESRSINNVAVQTFYATQGCVYELPETIILDEGSSPVICWTWDGYRVAFVSGEAILVYQCTSWNNWELEVSLPLPADVAVRSLEILGATYDPSGPYLFLAVHTYTYEPEETNSILFASCDSNGWSSLEPLGLEPQMANPQMILFTGAYTPAPQIYYHGGDNVYEMYLKTTVLHPSNGWTEPGFIMDGTGTPSPIMNEFDVAGTFYGDINILGLGAQPACPCGNIFLHTYNSVIQTWSVGQVTAHYSNYDWPMSPKIVASDNGFQTHAFWYQLATADDFTPWRKTLEYRVIENGDMVDAGDFLDEPGHGGSYGEQVAITVSPGNFPVLAWTRRDTIAGVPQPEQIWIAKKGISSAVEESVRVHPQLALAAWPNPFNPHVKIAFDVDETQHLRLDVFDTRGRRVATLLDSVVDVGHSEISWNARNNSGRRVPSGIYFARLISNHGKSVLKLVLTE